MKLVLTFLSLGALMVAAAALADPLTRKPLNTGPAPLCVTAKMDTFKEVLACPAAKSSVVEPFVLYDAEAPGAAENGPYRIWYRVIGGSNWYSADNWIEHAWSRDGTKFGKGQAIRTADPRGDVLKGYHQTGAPIIWKDKDGYRLYHFRYFYIPPIHSEWAGCMEISLGSRDGITFSKHIEHAMDPLYLCKQWDNYIVKPGSLLVDSGKFVMYYTSMADPHVKYPDPWTARAVSDDGLAWPKAEGAGRQRVKMEGNADWRAGQRPHVVHRDTGRQGYWMFYGGGQFATSDDGLNWTPRPPVLTEENLIKVMDKGLTHLGDFFYFKDPRNEKEYVYFSYSCATPNSPISHQTRYAKIGRAELSVDK